MNNSEKMSPEATDYLQLDQLLNKSADSEKVIDSSELQSRILESTRGLPQSRVSLWSRLARSLIDSEISAPKWGGALVVAGSLAAAMLIYPKFVNGPQSTVITAVAVQTVTEELSTEMLWEEILLLEEELAFSSL